jgi:serine phosphatase RsbU (regulator of sigma subunit)/tetratricopeptide (TPR) repeat protein
MHRLRTILLFILFVLPFAIQAQFTTEIDSLIQVTETTKSDTVKIDAYIKICDYLPTSDAATAIQYSHKAIQLAQKINDTKWEANARSSLGYKAMYVGMVDTSLHHMKISLNLYKSLHNEKEIIDQANNVGYIYYYLGEVDSALLYYNQSLDLAKKLEDQHGIAYAKSNLSLVFISLGKMEDALKYTLEALEIREKMGDLTEIGMSLINVGGIYDRLEKKETAYEYYKRGADTCAAAGYVSGEVAALSNQGTILYGWEQYDSALVIYERTLKVARSNGLSLNEGNALNNIGMVYIEKSMPDKALEYFRQSLEIRRASGNKSGIGTTLRNMGSAYKTLGLHDKAIGYYLEGYQIAEELRNVEEKKNTSRVLYTHYAKRENYKEAFKFQTIYMSSKDSILNKFNSELVNELNTKYETEKKDKELAKNKVKLAESVAQSEKDKAAAAKSDAKAEQETTLRYAFAVGFALMAVLAFFIFRGLQSKRKANEIITLQKDLVEEKNREILDSINYAKRIQSAILPPDKVVKEYLKQSFILYKPKDIVAGDFYWMEHVGNKVLFAAADCTGHGVPGAMVSVVCNNALNRSVREHGLTDPGKVLDKTREIVIQEFEKSDEEVKDGMDIALCSLEGNTLLYAGAHNPLWIMRNGEVLETKANKQPIGQFDNPLPYTTHTFELQKNDTIYIFSDGYVDQFGGAKGKKLKAANMRKLLLSIQDESMEKQRLLIDEAFESWRGDIEQVDDVCMIGVRI